MYGLELRQAQLQTGFPEPETQQHEEQLIQQHRRLSTCNEEDHALATSNNILSEHAESPRASEKKSQQSECKSPAHLYSSGIPEFDDNDNERRKGPTVERRERPQNSALRLQEENILDRSNSIDNQTAREYVNELMSRMSSHLESVRRSEDIQRSPPPRQTSLAFVTPNEKISESRQSEMAPEIAEQKANQDSIAHENQISRRYSIKNLINFQDNQSQIQSERQKAERQQFERLQKEKR